MTWQSLGVLVPLSPEVPEDRDYQYAQIGATRVAYQKQDVLPVGEKTGGQRGGP